MRWPEQRRKDSERLGYNVSIKYISFFALRRQSLTRQLNMSFFSLKVEPFSTIQYIDSVVAATVLGTALSAITRRSKFPYMDVGNLTRSRPLERLEVAQEQYSCFASLNLGSARLMSVLGAEQWQHRPPWLPRLNLVAHEHLTKRPCLTFQASVGMTVRRHRLQTRRSSGGRLSR